MFSINRCHRNYPIGRSDEAFMSSGTGTMNNSQNSANNYILVTGGLGYIGSHIVLQLLRINERCIILDNLSNSSLECSERLKVLSGKDFIIKPYDLRNIQEIELLFSEFKIKSVIHLAAFKAVGESVHQPLKYYENNVIGTINLLKVMQQNNVKKIVFSSSATVYGLPQKLPITEDHPVGNCANPYGRCKYMVEEVLRDLSNTKEGWKILILRYFNPIGADPSGIIGEDPKDIPNNLLPYVTQVAVGRHSHLHVFGSDYPTVDGTGVRDYVHVVDLASGHIKALEYIDKWEKNDYFDIFNLGTGRGYSVLEVVKAFESVTNQKIPLKIVQRREGDVGECFADSTKAKEILLWKCEYNIEDMCRDAWNWQTKNPNGFSK